MDTLIAGKECIRLSGNTILTLDGPKCPKAKSFVITGNASLTIQDADQLPQHKQRSLASPITIEVANSANLVLNAASMMKHLQIILSGSANCHVHGSVDFLTLTMTGCSTFSALNKPNNIIELNKGAASKLVFAGTEYYPDSGCEETDADLVAEIRRLLKLPKIRKRKSAPTEPKQRANKKAKKDV